MLKTRSLQSCVKVQAGGCGAGGFGSAALGPAAIGVAPGCVASCPLGDGFGEGMLFVCGVGVAGFGGPSLAII